MGEYDEAYKTSIRYNMKSQMSYLYDKIRVMISGYIDKKLKQAKYKLLKDRSYFGEIPGLRGVWANASSLEVCRNELREVIEEWLLLSIRNKEKIPGLKVKFDQRKLVRHA